jgi:hypothetical protein
MPEQQQVANPTKASRIILLKVARFRVSSRNIIKPPSDSLLFAGGCMIDLDINVEESS